MKTRRQKTLKEELREIHLENEAFLKEHKKRHWDITNDEINELLRVKSFMYATKNNLDMLLKYIMYPHKEISINYRRAGLFIKEEYGDDTYYEKAIALSKELSNFDSDN